MEQPVTRPDRGVVLGKSVARASAALGINGVVLARTLGVSEPTITRVLREERPISPDTKEGELALLLIRIYRSLDALVGTDDGVRKAWMTGYNRALGGPPIEVIQRADGLVNTVNYLDGMRAPA